MHDHHLEEMAKAITENIYNDYGIKDDHLDILEKEIKNGLKGYWKNKIALVWRIEDVTGTAKDRGLELSEDQAIEVLYSMLENHDPTLGVSWISIECALDDFEHNLTEC